MAAWKNIKKPVALALAGAMVFTSMACPGMSMKTNAAQKVLAFDTAEGGGQYATGGRVYDKYFVNYLEDYAMACTPI